MKTLAMVFLAGGLGCSARYGLGLATMRLGSTSPYGTLAANLLGCLAIGLVSFWVVDAKLMSKEMGTVLMTGFLGGLTTFSAFGLETVRLLQARELGAASANVIGSVLLGLLLVWVGLRVGAYAAPH